MRALLRMSPWLCLLAALCAARTASAQKVALKPQAKSGTSDSSDSAHAGYAGVKSGGAAAPGATATPGGGQAEITWPGFEMQPDGSSRVFLQSTVALSTNAASFGGKVVVDLGDAKVVGPNRFPLYTQFFNTPVTKVEIKRGGKKRHATLEISLRAKVEPRVASEHASSGFYFLYLDFPPGKYVDKPAAPPKPSAPPPPKNDDGSAMEDSPETIEGPPAPSGTPRPRARARASASASTDNELPPGIKPKKAGGKTSTKASGSIGIGR